MGPCTSTSKARHSKEKSPSINFQHPQLQSSQEGPGNIIKTASTADKNINSYPKPASVSARKNENFESDINLHLTPSSQECLKNIQNKKFMSSIKVKSSNGKDEKTDNDLTIKKHAESLKENRQNSGENDPGTLASKRPNFQKQIEKKKIDLKITMKNNNVNKKGQ